MPKNAKRIPSALKHGIYSGLGLLPTESPAKFRKFKKLRFAELNLVGRLEEDIGEELVLLLWRRQNLDTYLLAKRARDLRSSIYTKWVPPERWDCPVLEMPPQIDPPTPEELDALRKRAQSEIRTELGPAIELVEIGEVATYEYLEKELAIRERLDVMIARAYKKLAYMRAIKSMQPPALPPPSQPLLSRST